MNYLSVCSGIEAATQAWRGKDADKCPDGPRYKALGNSMAVNAMGWIGHRIEVLNHGVNPKAGQLAGPVNQLENVQ